MKKLGTFVRLGFSDKAAFCRAWCNLVAASVLVKCFGMTRSIRLMTRPADGSGHSASLRAVRWLHRASAYWPGGISCLPRSIAAMGLLHRAGIPAQLRLGVGPSAAKLEAHAWVEVDGRPFGDPPDVAQHYKPFPGC